METIQQRRRRWMSKELKIGFKQSTHTAWSLKWNTSAGLFPNKKRIHAADQSFKHHGLDKLDTRLDQIYRKD